MREAARTRHLDADVGGLRIHYREAGVPSSTAVLLLHGSPSSSFSFREILPVLGGQSYAVAPDLPGFGFSDAPSAVAFEYTWEQLALRIEQLIGQLGIERFVLYVTDFSTPVGYYLATRHPERVLGLVIQNGNAHEAGLGESWATARRFWADPTAANRADLPDWLTFEGTRDTYIGGLPDRLRQLYPPESWHLDWERMSRPGNVEIHDQLFYDYRRHVARFDEIARYHREHQPPCLVLWGRHDKFFDISEILAYHETVDTLAVHVFDSGHFLTETHGSEVAALVGAFVADLHDEASVSDSTGGR